MESNDKKNETKDESSEPNEIDERIKNKQYEIAISIQKTIEAELGAVQFLDHIAEENFDFIFQDATLKKYESELFDRLFNLDGNQYILNSNKKYLKSDYERLKIIDSIETLKNTSEKIALENGIKQPITKKIQKSSMIFSFLLFPALILIMSIPALANYYFVFLLIIMGGFCFGSQKLKQSMLNKWNDFKYKNRPKVMEELGNSNIIENIREFNQILINDCQDFCLKNNIPLQILRFQIFHKDYDNVNIIKEITSNNQVKFLCELKYPPGIEPIEVRKNLFEGNRNINLEEVEENFDDHNDLFISLRKIKYSNGNIEEIGEIKYLTEEEQDKIDELLNESEFFSTDNKSLAPNIINNPKVSCGCESRINLSEQKLVTTKYPGFEIYLIMGNKCKECGKNPYIILAKDESEIPDEFKGFL